ncbi:MAG: TetR/AcrR family transcriptional regulator [Marivibrio sp.]|uniref:TetR/AcrR family transcriptional regulator n=1 Tax=Marivibrio sp. TaxID=2039719 RepID=UPI0032ED947B
MSERKTDYHHGDLRAALIRAGGALLDEGGWEALSLRACAARAGVSHAAPAHHFGGRRGLLTALAADAFARFADALGHARETAVSREGEARPDAALRAAGVAYVRFARANPGPFKLMFGAADLDFADPEFRAVRRAAYEELGLLVRPYLVDPADAAEDRRLRLLVWSSVHGYAHLLISGQIDAAPDDPAADRPPFDLVPLLRGD